MNLRVDLNADLGEGSGHDLELLDLVTSASIACGFHAGDATTIHEALLAARERNVAVGAHPSLFDRANFGRTELPITGGEVFDLMVFQLGAFSALAAAVDIHPNHVKPHGALYNMAVRDAALADAIARAIVATDRTLLLFASDGSELARAGEAHGLRIAREVFADRNYLADGSLVSRTRPDALLHDPEAAATRVLRMLAEGVVRSVDGCDVPVRADTICVHGDTPEAVAFARTLRSKLCEAGIEIVSVAKSSP